MCYYLLNFLFFIFIFCDVKLIHGQSEQTVSGPLYDLSIRHPFPLRRIEFMTVTTDNMELSTAYYSGVLGANEMNFCDDNSDTFGTININNYCKLFRNEMVVIYPQTDVHRDAYFGLDDIGTFPNIGTNGDYEILSKFFLLGNSFIQLVLFNSIDTNTAFDLRRNVTAPTFMANAHIDFWIEDDIDINDYIEDVENRAFSLGGGGEDVKFNRPVPQTSREDRNTIDKSQYGNIVLDGPFGGLSWAYYKGPVGEQLEIYQIENTIKRGIGQAYCNRGAVSTAFIDTRIINNASSIYGWGGGDIGTPSYKEEISQKLHGIFQYGFRTTDIHRAVGFYAEILGGDLITYPTQGIQIQQDDGTYWMLFANETIESYEYADVNNIARDDINLQRQFGLANLSSTGTDRLDHRFILFDNFVVEPLEYTSGLSYGGEGFDVYHDTSSSPAYLGTVTASFGGYNFNQKTTNLNDYIQNFLQDRLKVRGFESTVKLPAEIATFPIDHPYYGLEYGFMKDVDGESIALVTINNRFEIRMKDSLTTFGGISTMFNETNPFTLGDMDRFCAFSTFTSEGFLGPNVNTATYDYLCDDNSNNHEGDDYDKIILAFVITSFAMTFMLFGYNFMQFRKINNNNNLMKSDDNNQF